MNNSAEGNGVVSTGGAGKARYLKKDFWSEENLRYSKPHFRMEKAARIINQLAPGQPRTLLDVGCRAGHAAASAEPERGLPRD